MTFLNKLLKRLRALFPNFNIRHSTGDIPSEIGDDETIVRGIVHSLHVSKSKGKLKREAFLPPPGKQDVSVLRLAYTNEHFCKKHTKKLASGMGKGSTYFGLATLAAVSVPETNKQVRSQSTKINLSIALIATPLEDLEMHADIQYSEVYERLQPNTRFRMVADILITRATLFPDQKPDSDVWDGSPLAR